jgi:CHAT domain-containing protein
LQGEHLGLSADSLAIMRDKILNLIEQRRDLMSKVMQASGHTVSHKENILTMKEVQKQLKSDEQIIEFFWGTDSIYSISISRETADITATSQDTGFDSLVLSVRNVLENQRSFNQAEKYGTAASIIYQKLFQPIITKRKIIVVPDETLNLIPIEALVSHTQTDAPTFKDLHYLIYDHEITYAYSSSILFHKNTDTQPTIKRVLAFSYSGGADTLVTDRENDLAPLSGTHEEVTTVSRIFDNVMLFSGPDALKGNFISHTSDHDLIHLGIHGIGDTEVADNSRLIFRSDSIESGDLYAYEIYNLKIDAKLVVLSGCETGLGKGQSGEGIFSIARAFSYAGCPSVVMSLWRAPDVFTGAIMKEFYEQVHQGKSIRSSLRTSKLKYLKGADELTAHPSNWAGLALNGKDQTFKKSTTPMTGWLILAGIGVAGAYLTMKRKKIKG